MCTRLWLQCNSRWYCSFLKENMRALGNCMQHYCIKKGKSSLVGDRELTFNSVVSSLRHLALFCTRKPQNCLLTVLTWLWCCSPLVLVICTTATSGPAWAVPQSSHKCPQNVLMQWHTKSRRWMTKGQYTARGNKQLPVQLQPVPHLHPLEVPVQGLPFQLALGTPAQPCPHPWPSTSLTAALAGATAPHFGDPSLQ